MVSKIVIGSSVNDKTKFCRIWMDGTPAEVVEKLSKKFKVYTERPVAAKKIWPTGGKEKVAKPKPENAPAPAA